MKRMIAVVVILVFLAGCATMGGGKTSASGEPPVKKPGFFARLGAGVGHLVGIGKEKEQPIQPLLSPTPVIPPASAPAPVESPKSPAREVPVEEAEPAAEPVVEPSVVARDPALEEAEEWSVDPVKETAPPQVLVRADGVELSVEIPPATDGRLSQESQKELMAKIGSAMEQALTDKNAETEAKAQQRATAEKLQAAVENRQVEKPVPVGLFTRRIKLGNARYGEEIADTRQSGDANRQLAAAYSAIAIQAAATGTVLAPVAAMPDGPLPVIFVNNKWESRRIIYWRNERGAIKNNVELPGQGNWEGLSNFKVEHLLSGEYLYQAFGPNGEPIRMKGIEDMDARRNKPGSFTKLFRVKSAPAERYQGAAYFAKVELGDL